MSQTLTEKVSRIQDIVNDLGEVLGPSGEGYGIDDVAFKDWADYIRARGELTQGPSGEQAQVNSICCKASGESAPSESALNSYLTSSSLNPSYMVINGTGSEEMYLRQVSQAISTSSETTRPLDGLKTLIVKDVKSVHARSFRIYNDDNENLKKIVFRNVDEFIAEPYAYGGTGRMKLGHIEELDMSGVKKWITRTEEAGSSLPYIQSAPNLKKIDLSGLEDAGDSGIYLGNTSILGNLEELSIGSDYTGSVEFGASTNIPSKLSRVEVPYDCGINRFGIANNAVISNTNSAFTRVGDKFVMDDTENSTYLTCGTYQGEFTLLYELGPYNSSAEQSSTKVLVGYGRFSRLLDLLEHRSAFIKGEWMGVHYNLTVSLSRSKKPLWNNVKFKFTNADGYDMSGVESCITIEDGFLQINQ